MNNQLKTILITTLVYLTVACKKDNYTPEVSNVPCLLTTITWVSSNDSVIANRMEYDEYRRLIKLSFFETTYNIEYGSNGKINRYYCLRNGKETSHRNYLWKGNILWVINEGLNSEGVWEVFDMKEYEFDSQN